MAPRLFALGSLSVQEKELLRGFGIFGAYFGIIVAFVIALLSLGSSLLSSWV